MRECPDCGFPLEAMSLEACPKCDHAAPTRETTQGILEIDIAHGGETWEVAKAKIDHAFDDALYFRHSGLKVIHGYGSTTGRSVIGPRAQAYLKHLAEQHGGRYVRDRHTAGASLVWLNR